jgi:hypothetical protein
MKKLLIGFAALPFLAGVAMAGQPTALSDAQMDKVTAGAGLDGLIEIAVFSGGTQIFEVNFFPTGVESGSGPSPEDPGNSFGGFVCGLGHGCAPGT